MKQRRRNKYLVNFSTTQMIMASFLVCIFIGSVLLSLPISSASGEPVPYIDALFTAATSVCVTGLVTLPTYSTWSIFGQAVMLVLIQIGGLGIVTIISGMLISFNRRLGLRDRMLLQDAFNLNSLSGIVKFLKKVIIGTFAVEGVGALMYMTVFVPQFGLKGIWISVFNAVSAFCNAGIDIISDNSLCDYKNNSMVNLTSSLLIILGGIGYIVWWDVLRVMKDIRKLKLRCLSALTFHSKLAITMSGILLLGGAIGFFVFEYNNPMTLGGMTLHGKIQAAMFQSVTTRTAGFATIPQQDFTNASAVLSLLLMFIGGSPVGTAGGVKTITIAVFVLSALAAIKNKESVAVFGRTIPKQGVSKAAAVITVSFFITFMSTMLLAAVTDAGSMDIAYEAVSAAATVGLTRDLTPSLNIWGKIIIIITMYLGRVGPISLLVAFNTKTNTTNLVKDPVEDISIG